MKRFALALSAAGLLAVLASAPLHSVEIPAFKSGRWQGSVVINEETGEFTGCIATAFNSADSMMIVEVDRDLDWRIGLARKGWNLPEGSRAPISFRFDNSRSWDAVAEAISTEILSVRLPQDGDALDGFRRSRQMHLEFGKNSLALSLAGTSQLMVDLVYCVEAFRGDS